MVLVVYSLENLQELLKFVTKSSPLITLGWISNRQSGLWSVGVEVERVTSYKSLGCDMNEKWSNLQETRCRIE